MHSIPLLALAMLASCRHQYLAIQDAEIVAGTPQYAYGNVWVAPAVPTFAVAAGSVDLTPDGDGATLEISFAGDFSFEVTEIVFLSLAGSDLGNHWVYTLDPEELAARTAQITVSAVSARPTKEWCTPKRLGTWTCFQRADQGIDGLGVSAAGHDSISVFAEVPLTLDPKSAPGADACDAYTVADCCGGATGVGAVECAWYLSCDCPDGTTDVGFYGDGNRRCVCPG